MTCKGAGGKKSKYMYYFCDNCNLYYNEDEIENCLIDYILDLVEYDFNVKKYFYPLLAEKKNNETKQIEEEIKKLEQSKERLMRVFENGIIKEEDFAKDYEFIEKKLAELDTKKIELLNFNKETFNPIHLLAERDIGVPVIDNCTRGMKKQVGKSQLFTKETLTKIQDKMRNACIKSYNKFYDVDIRLKEKQRGRNQDINVKDMGNYRETKRKLEQERKKLENANNQTKKIDNSSKDIIELLDNLKPMPFSKNNSQISNENIENIKNYIKDVTDVTKTVRSVNDLNISIKEFEHATFEIEKENKSLKNQIELKNEDIKELKNDLSAKEKIITKLKEEKESLKAQFQKFKVFWHSLMSHFHKRITYDNDQNYKIVSDDLYRNGIFDDNDNEIANNIYRKVTIPDENKNNKLKKKNDFNLN